MISPHITSCHYKSTITSISLWAKEEPSAYKTSQHRKESIADRATPQTHTFYVKTSALCLKQLWTCNGAIPPYLCKHSTTRAELSTTFDNSIIYAISATVMPYLCKKIQECEGSQAQVQALVTDCASHYVKCLTGPQCTGPRIQMCMH